MLKAIWRELTYLKTHLWDLSMLTITPLLIIIIFSSMLMQGKPEHLPIAIIDQDQTQLSANITDYLTLNHSLYIQLHTNNQTDAEKALNQTNIWGYVIIPEGAEKRLVQGQDAQIAITYNQSFFSIGNTISSAMLQSTAEATIDFLKNNHFRNNIPYLDISTPHIKISPLFNPTLNYELFLEPFLIPALLHLIICCSISFSVGQEIKFKTIRQWLDHTSFSQAIFAKAIVHTTILFGWSLLWLFWLTVIRGWFIAGNIFLLLAALFLLYLSYALLITAMTLALKDLTRTFGMIAIYGGSSLSFAGVTLPLNNAPLFTQFWSNLIPYTPYVRLQTQQWVVGSPTQISIPPFLILILFCMIGYLLSLFCLKKISKQAEI
ncbi:ABC transporter permease [Acinetobacter sp. B5B]|uniref:ABC transporter permease n=1 Tax=Acinetobacter baretiae TaxID=2605383 RepID=UPI0018C32B68|nr:ABC transporter permease [Acinetobacter baretiae]MBF7682680.1 ABC transporter permease [Acinetobacter baretiae]MBF7684914.1 ABC transporter permease [Acinetobacter baretiae]